MRGNAKREQICRGALEVFLQCGVAGTSMDHVAATAGVSKQTLYVYFRSKEELLVDVLGSMVNSLDERAPLLADRAVASHNDLRAVLSEVAWTLVSHLMSPNYLALFRIFIAEMVSTPALAQIWRETVPARFLARVETVLTHAREAGVIKDVDLDLATRLFIGPMMTFVFLDGLARPGNVLVPNRERVDEVVDLYLRAVT
ncbi:TetR/AcrR family transcriptional regulator [Micromonospora sp. CPCC 206061]|uniref:TetR/AcrR family transcriptional regulator n=1 Tax=Micromonospora sp. CPCC 206061 TaxID=3122410 RepID=UPI002FF1469B